MSAIKQVGLTLIEILIAMAILAGGIVVIVKFQGDLMRNLGATQQQAEAISLAESKLNELRNYTVIESGGSGTAYDDISSGSETVSNNSTTYTTTWNVTNVSDPPHKVIQVTVSWSDSAGQTQSVTLESIVGEVDPAKSGEVMQGL